MEKFNTNPTAKSDRIPRLVENLYRKMPEIEADRAVLLTESYRKTEGEPMVMRRAKAFAHILANIPIIIREEELVVGSSTLAPRGCQTFPEYSWEWLEAEFDTIEKRSADPFYISEETKARLREVHTYWKGKTNSELALSYMAPETVRAMEHNVFTPTVERCVGVGHVTVHYDRVLEKGLSGIIREAAEELSRCQVGGRGLCHEACVPGSGDFKLRGRDRLCGALCGSGRKRGGGLYGSGEKAGASSDRKELFPCAEGRREELP